MSSIARNLSAATGRHARTTLQRSQNVRSASSRWAIPATSLTSTDRMMSLPSSTDGSIHHDSMQSTGRWFSAASPVPTYRSMPDSAKSGEGDSFSKVCFIGAGKMAEVGNTRQLSWILAFTLQISKDCLTTYQTFVDLIHTHHSLPVPYNSRA